MKVFLDIDIGDAAKYQQESAAYQRAVDFMQQCGSQYGLSGNLADLDEEGLQMLREGYSNDPNWNSKGGQRCCRYSCCQCCCCRYHPQQLALVLTPTMQMHHMHCFEFLCHARLVGAAVLSPTSITVQPLGISCWHSNNKTS